MRRFSITQNLFLAALSTALLSSVACENKDKSQVQRDTSAQKPIEQAQRESEQAYGNAKEAQEKARSKQQEATKAEQDAVKKRDEAAQADQKAQQEMQQSQQLQEQARRTGEQAQRRAQSAQERALQAQQQADQQQQQARQQAAPTPTTPPTTQPSDHMAPTQQDQTQPQAAGTISIAQGTVQSSSQDELVIQRDNAPALRLKVDPQTTKITLDGQPAAITVLTQGENVAVSYRMDGGQPLAVRIEARQQPATMQP